MQTPGTQNTLKCKKRKFRSHHETFKSKKAGK